MMSERKQDHVAMEAGEAGGTGRLVYPELWV